MAAAGTLWLALAWPTVAESEPSADSPGTDRCAVPPDLITDQAGFPDLADRLRQGQPLVIVAIGGASTRGVGPLEQSYPARLQVALSRSHPASPIQVVNLGVARQTAVEMLGRLSRDVLPLKPQLVIWETGTNDAVSGVTLDDFAQALKDGVELLRGAGIDVLMMDMQYSRESAEVINFERYMETMQGIAEVGDARLFGRYAIMKYWSETGAFEFDGPMAERRELAAQVYDCIARRLVDAIIPRQP
jgi:lysophospholipase L1-like esterase